MVRAPTSFAAFESNTSPHCRATVSARDGLETARLATIRKVRMRGLRPQERRVYQRPKVPVLRLFGLRCSAGSRYACIALQDRITVTPAPLSTYAKLVAVPAIWGGTFHRGTHPRARGARHVAPCCVTSSRSSRCWSPPGGSRAACPASRDGNCSHRAAWPHRHPRLQPVLSRCTGPVAREPHVADHRPEPIVTIAVASLLLGERMSARRWLGVAVALAGVWIVVSRGDVLGSVFQAVGLGELLMFGGVCSWAAYTLIGRRVLEGLTPSRRPLMHRCGERSCWRWPQGPGRRRQGAHPPVHPACQPPARRDGHTDHPRPFRRGKTVRAGDDHRQRSFTLRRRAGRPQRALRRPTPLAGRFC